MLLLSAITDSLHGWHGKGYNTLLLNMLLLSAVTNSLQGRHGKGYNTLLLNMLLLSAVTDSLQGQHGKGYNTLMLTYVTALNMPAQPNHCKNIIASSPWQLDTVNILNMPQLAQGNQ